jgi:excisionase family DNA binding protein
VSTRRRPDAATADPTTAGVLRDRLAAALASAMRRPEPEAIALTADRVKAMGVALAGTADASEVQVGSLELGTQGAATVLGYHPEHVRRLIRTGRLRARRVGGDYRLRVDDLWPLIEARYREPGRRRPRATR